MQRRSFLPRTSAPAVLLLLLLTAGCQPATPYETATSPAAPAKPNIDLRKVEYAAPVTWANPRPDEIQPDASLVFVHESDGAEWTALPRFWNPPPTETQKAVAALALFPGAAAALAELKPVVKIKTPAGLDDPRPFLPAADPPTLHRWELGRRLFYDKAWLTDGGGLSCATCHDPRAGFADNARDHYGVNTPTLLNCVYNRRQFWDGRAAALEEVVQQTPEDETAPAKEPPPFRHVWPGVVRRLRARYDYEHQFRSAFGTIPTQDAVGKAVATYLRTLLAGDSVYDRARRAQAAEHAPAPKPEHYEQALDAAALQKLGFDRAAKAEAAKTIYRGDRLFHDLEERKTGCVQCHGPAGKGTQFSDGGFHNLGVGWTVPDLDHPPGRFGSLPVGGKERALMGAYKTPTLRGLSRTAPYFHDGSAATLQEAIRFHADGGKWNDYLDARLVTRDVPAPDLAALALFLRALDGEEADAAVGLPAQ